MIDQNEFEKMTQAEQTAYLNKRAKDKGMYYNSGGILKGNSMLGIVSAVNEAMSEPSEPEDSE